jgi:hypothetical protein
MTVTVDDLRRIHLPLANPGEAFDVKKEADGTFILTPESSTLPGNKVKFIRKDGYTVGVTEHPIDMDELNRLLKDFP